MPRSLITGPASYRSAIERTGGFIDALSRRGIELPKARIVEAGYTFESGVAAAEKLLGGKRRPSAIFCGNDEWPPGCTGSRCATASASRASCR